MQDTFTRARTRLLYARYICSRDAFGLKAAGRPSAARDDRVSCIQTLLGQARDDRVSCIQALNLNLTLLI